MSFWLAISGRNAAMKFSPLANMKVARITQVMPSATSPRPTKPSSAVNSTQPMVVKARNLFLCAP